MRPAISTAVWDSATSTCRNCSAWFRSVTVCPSRMFIYQHQRHVGCRNRVRIKGLGKKSENCLTMRDDRSHSKHEVQETAWLVFTCMTAHATRDRRARDTCQA